MLRASLSFGSWFLLFLDMNPIDEYQQKCWYGFFPSLPLLFLENRENTKWKVVYLFHEIGYAMLKDGASFLFLPHFPN